MQLHNDDATTGRSHATSLDLHVQAFNCVI